MPLSKSFNPSRKPCSRTEWFLKSGQFSEEKPPPEALKPDPLGFTAFQASRWGKREVTRSG